jgi:hypothetical protein
MALATSRRALSGAVESTSVLPVPSSVALFAASESVENHRVDARTLTASSLSTSVAINTIEPW